MKNSTQMTQIKQMHADYWGIEKPYFSKATLVALSIYTLQCPYYLILFFVNNGIRGHIGVAFMATKGACKNKGNKILRVLRENPLRPLWLMQNAESRKQNAECRT
jgi:hypothetical protein